MEKKRKAFTLIELLVVIAIIALLMSIVMPALKLAKLKAQGAVCLANVNGLSKAWLLYADENNNEVVGAFTSVVTDPVFSWVEQPQDDDGNPAGGNSTVKEKINGIEKGLLYPYVESPKAYHCPSDRRSLRPPVAYPDSTTGVGGYRTYSIVGGVRGVAYDNRTGRYIEERWGVEAHTKTTTIKSPGNKYVFVEEMAPNGINWQSWILEPKIPDRWRDPIAIWHGDASMFGFADGHGEKYRWHQKEVIEMCEQQTFLVTAPGEDTEWIHRGYPYLRILE